MAGTPRRGVRRQPRGTGATATRYHPGLPGGQREPSSPLDAARRTAAGGSREGWAESLSESARHRETLGHWCVLLFLLIPDHLHALVVPAPEPGLARTMAAWKRFTARRLGLTWQRGWFEHRIRQGEALEAKAEYIRQNPVRAGLVTDAAAWAYVWPKLPAPRSIHER